MSVHVGCGLSDEPDPVLAATRAAEQARAQLGPYPADLVLVFCTGVHLDRPEESLAAVHEVLAPGALAGCGASGVVGQGREIEDGSAISVWAAHLDGGRAESFHTTVVPLGEVAAVEGVPDLSSAAGVILLPDPYTFPTDRVLAEVPTAAPGVPILGGLSSGRTPDDEAVLFFDQAVVSEGAVGVLLEDLEVLPCVSQGATPVGPELTVTAGEGNVIHELAGRPALVRLREAIEQLTDDEREMLSGGLLLGIVIDGNHPEYLQGDFLVRGLVGADPDEGSIAVGAPVALGQVVRLHARDAASADADLRAALELRRTALGGAQPAGVLAFTCNGRGEGMFGVGDHDATVIADVLAGAPTSGFFAAGEIGPVGGQPFVHTFTATLALIA